MVEAMKSYCTWKLFAVTAGLLLTITALHAQDATNLPLVVVVAPDPTALEGTSSGAFTLIRYGSTDSDLAVNIRLSGSASNGVDYAMINSVITIPAGSLAADVTVDPINGSANRGNKTVILSLETDSNYRIGEHHRAQVKIIDDIFDLLPPVVSITSPTNNSTFTNPPSITVTADANDPDAAISSVSFYANDDFLGKATNAPYSVAWNNPRRGRFALFARAVDQFGRSAISAPVHITVTETHPMVTLTSPTNGANFVVHQDVSISADASDPDGNSTISSVKFYANNHLLGAVTSSPFSLVWSNVPAGVFHLRAVAIDSAGEKGTSKPVLINVSRFPAKKFSK